MNSSMTRFNKIALLAGTAITVSAFSAYTAAAQTVPKSVDPSKLEKRFESKQKPETSSSEAVPTVDIPEAVGDRRDSQRTFTLKAVAIDGATVYSEAELSPLFAEYLNQKISIADAKALANKITLKYRNDGYILSQAILATQPVSGSTLNIQVVEGFISNVVIQGEDVARTDARNLLGQYGNQITGKRPLHIDDLERYLLLMDDLPGATAKGVVRPAANTFGAAELVVTVTHKMYEGAFTADNRGTDFVGPFQFSTILVGNSVFSVYERTTIRGITTGDTEELKFVDVQHEQQLDDDGTRLILSGSHSNALPGDTIKSLNIDANSNSYRAQVTHPYIRSRTENLEGRVTFDYRNTDTNVLGADFTDDRLRVARLGGSYDFADSFRGVNLVDTEVSTGLNIFNPSSKGTNRTRANGDSSFTKVTLDFTRTQPLPMQGVSVLTSFTGQYSADNLLAAEQFSIGGAAFGSAYDPSELTGDHGAAARAELRYGDFPGMDYLRSYQAYAFYDIGAVWNRDNTLDNHSLASTGVGVRTNFTTWLSGSAELALPLTKQVTNENDDDPRVFFSVTGRF